MKSERGSAKTIIDKRSTNSCGRRGTRWAPPRPARAPRRGIWHGSATGEVMIDPPRQARRSRPLVGWERRQIRGVVGSRPCIEERHAPPCFDFRGLPLPRSAGVPPCRRRSVEQLRRLQPIESRSGRFRDTSSGRPRRRSRRAPRRRSPSSGIELRRRRCRSAGLATRVTLESVAFHAFRICNSAA